MRIYDLAVNLIKLSGLRVGRDIEVVFTGLRPGEKLYEELRMDGEDLHPTENKSILVSTASPPTRIAPERVNAAVSTFYAPVDDFELSEIRLRDATTRVRVRGIGPRTVLCLQGAAQLEAGGQVRSVISGQAVFVPACDGELTMRGIGHLVQAAVP